MSKQKKNNESAAEAPQQTAQEPLIAQRVATFEVMMTLVSAGLALGLAGAAHIASSRELNVVARPLAGRPPMLTTYLLRRDTEPTQVLARFIERFQLIGSTGGDAATIRGGV